MIVAELILFCGGLVLGMAARLLFVAVSKLEKAIALKPITIILDTLMAGTIITAFVVMQFVLGEGVFVPHSAIASAIGFVFMSLII